MWTVVLSMIVRLVVAFLFLVAFAVLVVLIDL